ncbi:response regulator [Cerasicoccus maritimus]|uniref:response regulator n=1 Tax=Cerasicoccus maritimus TaxID=490089 RepID=UPI0028528158|nr:response regulator [Cerasicoccus maritimus]
MPPESNKQLILVVDDQPINIKLLQRKLEREGYEVLTAYNGQECLNIVAKRKPDLILLDVMMPEMDGIETCEKLKENEDTETIPVIFITAKSSKEGKLEGLGVGAVDYITKPIDLEETLARVKTQLRIQEIYRENIELQTQLGEIRRSAAVGAITQGIAHNLNNLLGVVVGYLDLLRNGYDSPDMVKRSVSLMDQAIQRMVNIIRHLSSIATSERVQIFPLEIKLLIDGALERFHDEFEVENSIPVEYSLPENFKLEANRDVFESVLLKLLVNSWEAYHKGTEDEEKYIGLKIGLSDDAKSLLVKVIDQGSGIPSDIHDHIFDPFITSKTSVGRGLGLTMARHSMRNLQGDLEVVNRADAGVVATMIHPVKQPKVEPTVSGSPPAHKPHGSSLISKPSSNIPSGVSRHD